jgi:hypothetical protein
MKDFFAENFGNFWKKSFVLRKISGLLFSKNNVDLLPPPSPVANVFRENLCFPEKNLGGPLEWKGPKFWNTPPPTDIYNT